MPVAPAAAANPLPFLVGTPMTLDDLEAVACCRRTVRLDEGAREAMRRSREAVEAIARGGDAAPAVYGVNTGFGFLSETRISAHDVRALQRNLVRSHACEVGPRLTDEEVRAKILLRAQVIALGCSGVRVEVAELLLALLNHGIHPVIPSQGSVGASGDLAPLAHLALVLIGEGEAIVEGKQLSGAEALAQAGLAPVVLEAKEGLGLINGTQYMAHLAEGEYEGIRAEIAFSGPQDVTGNSKGIWFFVQGRWVQDRSLQAAVMESYRGLLMHGEFQYVVAKLWVPDGEVDVNIHPTKLAIKFRDPSRAFRAISRHCVPNLKRKAILIAKQNVWRYSL